MKIIDRYILKSHIGPFLFSFVTIIFVLIPQFFTTFADRFIGKGIGFAGEEHQRRDRSVEDSPVALSRGTVRAEPSFHQPAPAEDVPDLS